MTSKGSKGHVVTLASIVQPQDGQAVITVALILMVAGTFILLPFLALLPTALTKGQVEREQRYKILAAEAGMNRVIADLIRGADGVATTYTTTEPHTGGTFQTYTITTAYTPPAVTVNDYTPTVTLSLPTASQAQPTIQQSYVDPGVTHPGLATVAGNQAYMMRLYNVKAGTLQVNWAYSPASSSQIKVWAGIPAENGVPIPAGALASAPQLNPILDTGTTNSSAVYVRSAPLTVDPATDGSGGVYTIVFDNKSNSTKTTAAFAPSGGTSDTWIYIQARKDYIVTSSVGGVSVSAYLRQVPGFTEPPAVALVSGNSYSYTFATNNVSFITNEVSVYSWIIP
ncbi:MAG: hypothetical protein HY687_01095 [Chloroflexi bacterium]|nr:hypothetical protein [Chloroflexota bacterium]